MRAASHVASVATDDGFVVSHLVHSSIYVLEGTGGAVWADIVGASDGAVDVGALVVALAAAFDTPVGVVGPSVHDLLLDLVDKDLVEVLPPA